MCVITIYYTCVGERYKFLMKINENETFIPSEVNLNDELTVRRRRTYCLSLQYIWLGCCPIVSLVSNFSVKLPHCLITFILSD